jgi:hypothetical protein
MAAHPTMCFKVPIDLQTAIVAMAERDGVSVSEWLRDKVHRIVYGEPLGMEQGYLEGRQLGFRMLQLLFQQTWDQAPATLEDALQLMQEFSRTRVSKRG